MKILSPFLFTLVSVVSLASCSNQMSPAVSRNERQYEINIRTVYNYEAINNTALSLITGSGLRITAMQRLPLTNGRNEMKVRVKCDTPGQLRDAADQLEGLMYLEQLSIHDF